MINGTNETVHVWSTNGPEFLAALLSLGFVSLIGLAGNGLVVAIILAARHRGEKNAVQLFLFHLALSDLMVCLLCIPLTILMNFNYPAEVSGTEQGLCKVTRYVQFLAPSSSIAILTVISIDRFYSLVKPFKRGAWFRRPYLLISTAWLYAGVIFLPTFYFAKMEHISTNHGPVWYCATIPNDSLIGFIYLLFLFIAAFVVPLTTMIVLYVRVGKAVWSRQRKISRSSNTYITKNSLSVLQRSRRRVTRMLLIVVVVFLFCWSPFVIYTGFIERYVASFPNPADAARLVLYSLGLANSICNPFIYYLNSEGSKKGSFKNVCFEAVLRRATTKSDNPVEKYQPQNGTVFTVYKDGSEAYDTRF